MAKTAPEIDKRTSVSDPQVEMDIVIDFEKPPRQEPANNILERWSRKIIGAGFPKV